LQLNHLHWFPNAPTTIISKDSNDIEEAHVLFNKEDNLPNFDVVAFLVPYDVILVPTSDPFPKPTLVAHVFCNNKCRQITNSSLI